MKCLPTDLPEVVRIQPKVFEDERGFFFESYQKRLFKQFGLKSNFVQDNFSSSKQHTLRGIHYQVNQTQGKLVRVVIGEIFDVAVDLRMSSSSFGKWVGVFLSAENKEQLWVPPGFGHGFFALSPRADVFYKTTDYFNQKSERCIHWNDPTLNIDWQIPPGITPIISEKDAAGTLFIGAEVFL